MNVIFTKDAPEALGPYSQAILVGNTLFASGQIPITPQGILMSHSIEVATNQVFDNIEAVLSAAGMSLHNVVKTTVFLKDLNDFDAMNIVYAERFQNHQPARSTIQVAKLPKDVPVEIEVIAVNEKAVY